MNRPGVKSLLVAFVSVLVAAFGYNAYAVSGEMSQEFSADVINRAEGKTMNAKICSSKGKMRMEMQGSIVIIRPDKNVSYMVMPSEKMYMEQPINRKMLPKTSSKVEGELERVSLGKEKIDGKQAEKFKVTYTQNGSRTSMYQWLLDSGFPVKMEALDGSWGMEYKKLSFASQPDELFEPPAGYQKMSMPFGAGGGVPSVGDIMSQIKNAGQ